MHQQDASNTNTSIWNRPRKAKLRRPVCKSADITFLDKHVYLFTAIPRLTTIIRSGNTFVSRNLR